MTKQVIPITITLMIDVDAEDADKLAEQEGILGLYGESQTPVPGINDLAHRITDSCIQKAFEFFAVNRVNAVLDDAITSVGERRDEERLSDWFY
jgi:hypothetical protein